MCWVAWDKITKPKAKGGLGIRDIQLTNHDCLLIRVLLGKYCHKKSLLDVQLPTVYSHGWRSILHGRDLLRGKVGKAISNGNNTKLGKILGSR